MRAYHLETPGTVDGIAPRETDRPEPGPRDILVRVRAVSLNKRDLLILNGTYPLKAVPDVIPLSDGAGEVVAVGAEVTRFAVGDRVASTYSRSGSTAGSPPRGSTSPAPPCPACSPSTRASTRTRRCGCPATSAGRRPPACPARASRPGTR
ncbi:alcohol dehydrogenase catalytic domain-containing protein [Streptomyces sp. OK228]|uniref:alcohol dehydrogenase catalytic domain-containing protein n=1 Tax=Streptomyces sp. OK228 TaxID=1882786 RepID=UPI00211CBB89|nr:alcohol dehydrogenase catalytic domain-containing protein [Streptomyces sp. OK228]